MLADGAAVEQVMTGPTGSDYALARGAAMLNGEFVPGFPLRDATKDAELALSAAHRHGLELPLLPRWYEAIAGDHGGDDVASAVTAAATTASPPGSRMTFAAS